MNRVRLSVRVTHAEALRHTPAGVPILQLQLGHESQVHEAGIQRQVVMSLAAVAVGDLATQLAADLPQGWLEAQGFLAPLRKESDRLVLHLETLVARARNEA